MNYQIGYNYELDHKYEQALNYFHRAMNMFELRNDAANITFLTDKLKKLSGSIPT